MSDIRIVEHTEQPTAVVRETVPMEKLGELLHRALPATMSAASAQGVEVTGPPFVKYIGGPSSTVDVEAGFPVSRPVRDAEGVTAGTLPGGAVVEAVHVGPYDTLPQAYEELGRWMAEREITGTGVTWECYLTDPASEPDPATWRTLVACPVARSPEEPDGSS